MPAKALPAFAEHNAVGPARITPSFAQGRRCQERGEPKGNPALPAQETLSLVTSFADAPALSTEDQEKAERRLATIRPLIFPGEYRPLWAECGGQKEKVKARLAAEAHVSSRTIEEWEKRWRDEGLPALVRKGRSNKGVPRIPNSAAFNEFLLKAAIPEKGRYGALSVKEIYRAYREERDWRVAHTQRKLSGADLSNYARYVDENGKLREAAQLPAVSYETMRRWFNQIPEAVRVFSRQGLEAFSNTQEILSFRDIAEIKVLDYVVMDHRRLDFFCLTKTRDGWKLIRPWLTAAIDFRSRKWLAWVIVETPSSDSIASVLKRTFIYHGLPKSLYWDNGKDFRCEWFEGRHERARMADGIKNLDTGMAGVLDTLGVRVHHAIVRRARAKIIEPNFIRTANFDATLPTYCGNKPTARPELFDQLLDQYQKWLKGEAEEPPFQTIEQVAPMYDRLMETLNERELQGEGMQKVTPTGRGWMCPNECFEKLIGQVERKTISAEVLQFCFAKRREITVKHGEIRTTFGGQVYHYRLADSSSRLMNLNGCTVQLAYDPLDLETVAVYYENRLIGLANCIALRRMGEALFVEDEKDRRRARRAVREFVTAVHKGIYVPDPIERLERRAAVLPARMEPKRPERPVEVPAAILEASQAAERDKSFSFAGTGADLIRQSDAAAYRDDKIPDDDSDFVFFSNASSGGTK